MASKAKKSKERANLVAARADGDSQARLAVNLPVSTHRQLKARAAEEGSSIRDYILELLRKNGIS
jgi:hypothetical protein